jgi:hypothetical protein
LRAESAAAASRHLSLVFFHNPNYDTPVAALPGTTNEEAPKYPPATSGGISAAIRPNAGVKAAAAFGARQPGHFLFSTENVPKPAAYSIMIQFF